MTSLEKWMPQMLSILRIVTGLLFMEHGLQKFFGFPAAGPELNTLLWTQGAIELIGGLLLLLGIFTRLVAFIMAGDMAVAYFMAHFPKSLFPVANGGDAAILYCFVFLLLFVAGGGPWSVDQSLKQT